MYATSAVAIVMGGARSCAASDSPSRAYSSRRLRARVGTGPPMASRTAAIVPDADRGPRRTDDGTLPDDDNDAIAGRRCRQAHRPRTRGFMTTTDDRDRQRQRGLADRRQVPGRVRGCQGVPKDGCPSTSATPTASLQRPDRTCPLSRGRRRVQAARRRADNDGDGSIAGPLPGVQARQTAFEDDDGCPRARNDREGTATKRTCPLEAETVTPSRTKEAGPPIGARKWSG